MENKKTITENKIARKYEGIRKTAFYILFAFSLIAGVSCNDDDDDIEVADFSGDTEDFVIRAGFFNVAEIEFAKVAIERAQDERVRAYAQKILNEHTAAQNELTELGTRKGLIVPQGLSEQDIETLEELKEENADGFDEEYTEQQVRFLKFHENDFQDEAEDGDDQDVKNYAAKYYPVIAANQDTADDLEDAVD